MNYRQNEQLAQIILKNNNFSFLKKLFLIFNKEEKCVNDFYNIIQIIVFIY